MSEAGAVVIGTDGVLLATAARHAAIWEKIFDGCLRLWQPSPAAGPPRASGTRAFLASRPTPGRPREMSARCARPSRRYP